jgi:hypothetical protein
MSTRLARRGIQLKQCNGSEPGQKEGYECDAASASPITNKEVEYSAET